MGALKLWGHWPKNTFAEGERTAGFWWPFHLRFIAVEKLQESFKRGKRYLGRGDRA
jgi:hypothetical protein